MQLNSQACTFAAGPERPGKGQVCAAAGGIPTRLGVLLSQAGYGQCQVRHCKRCVHAIRLHGELAPKLGIAGLLKG